jgi:hypothetical protein
LTPHTTISLASVAGADLISIQKSLSPLEAVALTVVLVFRRIDGRLPSLRSTETLVLPFLMGKLMALKVSDPVPSGRPQVFDCDASPLQDTVEIAVFISRSKFAAETSSSRVPVPVMCVVAPVLAVPGVKPVILTWLLESPQSAQVSFKSAVLAAESKRAPTLESTPGVLSLSLVCAERSGCASCASVAGADLISIQKSLSPLEAVALTVVSVFRRIDGRLPSFRSTDTLVLPFFIGKLMALKVSDPVPSGRPQVFDCDASPLQDTVEIAVFISRSKFAAEISSSRVPVPVMRVVAPVLAEPGVKPVILTWVLESPQSAQVSFKSAAVAAESKRAPTTAFIMFAEQLSTT